MLVLQVLLGWTYIMVFAREHRGTNSFALLLFPLIVRSACAAGIAGLEKELGSMGGPPVTSRGGMVHLILSLCRQFEEAFGKAVDGGKGGGEQILRVFEERLGQNIQQLQFKKVGFPKKERTDKKEQTRKICAVRRDSREADG